MKGIKHLLTTIPGQFILACIIVCIFACLHSLTGSDTSDVLPEYQFLDSRRNSVTAFDHVDSTDDYIYFSSHSLQGRTYLEIWNHAGEFQRAVLFDDHSNGIPQLRSHENKMFLRLNSGAVFAFSGAEIAFQLTNDQAKKAGYSFQWFQHSSSKVKVGDSFIYVTDTSENTEETIPFSYRVQQEPSNTSRFWIIVKAFIPLVMCIGAAIIGKYLRGKT